MSDRFILDIEYKKLAKKYNITEKQVKEIYESQFAFGREAMKEGTHDDAESFKNINYIYLGKLYVKKGVVEKYKRMKDKKKKERMDKGLIEKNEVEFTITEYSTLENLNNLMFEKFEEWRSDNIGQIVKPKFILYLSLDQIKKFQVDVDDFNVELYNKLNNPVIKIDSKQPKNYSEYIGPNGFKVTLILKEEEK